ncbi:MAG: dipeptide epimerase [Longimicrobiaceae bacterium]
MKIDFEVVELVTRHAFHIAREAAPPAWRTVWVRVRHEDGKEGWGEAAPSPFYGETADTVRAVMPRLAEAVTGSAGGDELSLERVEREVERAIGHHAAAKAGVSAALHDLAAKRLGVPLWRLLGLDPATAPRSSFTIGIDQPEVMREKVREAAAYQILKIKVGGSQDEEVLALVRDQAPDKKLRVDANTSWTLKEAVRALPMLEEYGVELLEQPLHPDDLEGMRILRGRSRLPLIADESCRTSADVPRLAGAVDGVNLKLAKCGGIREAVRTLHAARAHGMEVMLGCMIESTLGIAAAIQIAPLMDYLDLDGAALLAGDPFTGPGIGPDGVLRFNQEPGLGVARVAR